MKTKFLHTNYNGYSGISRILNRAIRQIKNENQAYREYKHSLTFRVLRYVVIATKPVHRLQIRPIVHN